MISRAAQAVLDRFLRLDPADAGCAQTVELLHAYAELAATGTDPERAYPGLTAHLRVCAPCADDLAGLVITVRETDATY
jgi:hypothetical protein